jgi:hypothetical protein
MTNLTTFNPSQTPAFVKKAELSSIAKALAGSLGGGSTKRISIRGGVFRLLSGGKEVAAIDDRHLDVVIVNAAPKVSRTFYAGQYIEGEAKGPDCWSADGDVPDPTSADIQSASCATCPQNIKGSGQGDSRACRYSQRLAVVLANDLEGDVMQLTLAATSIFGKDEGEARRPLQAYARFLAAQNISPEMVVTRLKFDTKAAVPKMFFMPVRWLDDGEYASAIEKGATEDAKKAVTMTVAQADNTMYAAKTFVSDMALQISAGKARVKPVVEEDELVDEPEVRKETKAKPTAVPKKAKSLADVVDNWDADDE